MAGIYHTRQDLIRGVLEELKIAAYGQSPSAAEYSIVDDNLDTILQELDNRTVVSVTIPDAVTPCIPGEIFMALSQAVGRLLANKFSITPQEVALMMPSEGDPFSPENRLRAINRARMHRAPANPDYF